MPIIFAQALMFIPNTIATMFGSSDDGFGAFIVEFVLRRMKI